jgi:glucose-6-phosphate isomerase
MSLDTPLFQHHGLRPWSLDATQMSIDDADLDTLPWSTVFGAMDELEAGAIANPDEGRQVGHYWLRALERAPTVGQAKAIGDAVVAVRAFAAGVRDGSIGGEGGEAFTDVLHIGIGGSALGPRLLIAALDDGRGLRLHFLDNIDPDGINRVLSSLGDRLRTTLVVVVSKSGGTVETAQAAELVRRAVVEEGLEWPVRCVAITAEGSKLERQAKAEGWRAIFPMWDWVGGRFSVLSAVGLLPAEFAGIESAELLAGAAEMDAWTRHSAWRENPAALLAGCWYLTGHGRGDRNMVVLPYSDRLELMSRYLQQLVMESLGQRLDLKGREVEQGITVYGNKGSTDQHAFVQQLRDGRRDAFITFVQVLDDGVGDIRPVDGRANAGDLLQGFLVGTRRALADEDRPSITITIPSVNAAEVGAFIALFERAVGFYATLVGINCYHQPGVEAGKKAAVSVIATGERLRDLLTDDGRSADELAEALHVDAVELYYVLQRLASTGRAAVDGSGASARFRRVSA